MPPKWCRTSLWVLGLVAFAAPTAATAADLPAFPGAVGQGAKATGGRGGDVYHVTNLDDYNSDADQQKIPGSLRHAIRSADGPRTIVFDVSGPIALACPLKVMKNEITIAGQTSPGGITLWGYPFAVSQSSDVVVRYLRVRLGDFHARRDSDQLPPDAPAGNNDLDPNSANAVGLQGGSERVILDHISVAWGMDETLSVTHCKDVTVQHSMITESLRQSFHSKGAHGYGSLVRGELTPVDQQANVGGFTFFGNLWAHHDARNPSIAGQQRLEPDQQEEDRRRADVNLVNCVVYNWGNEPTHRSNYGDVRINLLHNYYASGPAKRGEYIFRGTDTGRTQIRHEGNVLAQWADGRRDAQVVGPDARRGFHDMTQQDEVLPADPSFAFLTSRDRQEIVAAEDALQRVIATAGASLWRDAVDRRVIAALEAGEGALIDSQEEFREGGRLPGIDDLSVARRPDDFDTDRDGMPDEFERRRGLDPDDPADHNGTTLSDQGYTNLEMYLHEAATAAQPRP